MLRRFFSKKANSEIIKKTQHMLIKSITIGQSSDNNLQLKSAGFDNDNMEVPYTDYESSIAYKMTPLFKIPKSDYDTKIMEHLSSKSCVLKLINPDISSYFHPELIHFMELNFIGSLNKYDIYRKIETIDIIKNGKYIETIERDSRCIALNDIPLDAFLKRFEGLPNVNKILDYYQTTYSKPKEHVVVDSPRPSFN